MTCTRGNTQCGIHFGYPGFPHLLASCYNGLSLDSIGQMTKLAIYVHVPQCELPIIMTYIQTDTYGGELSSITPRQTISDTLHTKKKSCPLDVRLMEQAVSFYNCVVSLLQDVCLLGRGGISMCVT